MRSVRRLGEAMQWGEVVGEKLRLRETRTITS